MFTSSPGGRATVSGASFQLGLATFQFDLVTVFAKGDDDEDTSMQVACPHPSHAGQGVKASQRYLCELDASHGPYMMGELARRADNADNVSVVIDAEEVKAIKTGGLEEKLCQLRAYPALEIEHLARPGAKGYLLRPAKVKNKITAASEAAYALLHRYVAEHPEVALVGDILTPTRRTFQVSTYGRQLFLQQIVLPSQQRALDTVEPPSVDERNYAQLEYLVDLSTEHFDEGNHTWDVAEAMTELKARATAAANNPQAAPAVVFDAASIDAALEAAVAARLAAKAAEVPA